MSDDDDITQDERVDVLSRHRLLALIGLSIAVTIAFTSVGLILYNTSGTAQLDLSRPGFQGVDAMVKQDQAKTDFVEYPSSGPINEGTLSQFDELYKKQLQNVTSVKAFRGDPMAPEALGIDDAVQETFEE